MNKEISGFIDRYVKAIKGAIMVKKAKYNILLKYCIVKITVYITKTAYIIKYLNSDWKVD